MNNNQKFQNIITFIDWKNWKISTESDEQEEFMDICDVLRLKLNKIKDTIIKCGTPNDQDSLQTIDNIQDLLSILDENKINTILIN